MTAEPVGPMPFNSNSWTRFFSVSLHVVGLSSRSCSIVAICCWTSPSLSAGNLPGEPWRQGPSLSGHQLVDLERLVASLYVDAADALGKQQSLYAIDVRRPLAD